MSVRPNGTARADKLPPSTNKKSASQPKSRLAAISLLLLYIVIVLTPLTVTLLYGKQEGRFFYYKLGLGAGVVGLTILAMQFVLAARLKWLERPFGMDMVYQFHRSMGMFAGVLLLCHPLILAAAGPKWWILYRLHVSWFIWLGRVTLLVLVIHALLAIYRRVIKMEYQRWQNLHSVLAFFILGGGLVHSWFAGGDLKLLPMRVLWIVLFLAAGSAYLWHRFRAPVRLQRRPYVVKEVKQEAQSVWTVEMAPETTTQTPDYLPGQYHYLTLFRQGLPVEEHPFSISSSPTQSGIISSTIKASGDFTSTIEKTKPGDTVLVDAPFGRFSYVLHDDEKELVFIAGGVGITPLMSMLRHMRDTQTERNVLFMYSNQKEEDIIFREELAQMEQVSAPRVKVVHMLSKPAEGWEGEAGRLDEEKLKKYCPDMASKGFYICGPPGLNDSVTTCLDQLGVPSHRIHYERFEQ